MRADSLLHAATHEADEERRVAPQLEAFAVLGHAIAALERRRQGGTLLTGACCEQEAAWYAFYAAQHASSFGQALPAAAELGRAVGHSAFLMAARLALERLTTPLPVELQFSAESPEAEVYYAFVLAALELLRSPRPREDVGLPAEDVLEGDVRGVIARLTPPRVGFAAALAEAWDAVLSSGACERRRAAQGRPVAGVPRPGAGAGPPLQRCGFASCGVYEPLPAKFKSCAACRRVFYCSKQHQVADWRAGHKAACKAAPAEAAER